MNVDVIDACGRNFYDGLIGLGLWSWKVDEGKDFGPAGFLNLYRFHRNSLHTWILSNSIYRLAPRPEMIGAFSEK